MKKTALTVNSDGDKVLVNGSPIIIKKQGPRIGFFRRALGLKKLIIASTLILIALAGYAGHERFFYFTTEKQNAEELEEILSQVSKLIILPQDDKPLLATVTDVEKLKQEQAFFELAENGDHLLIFPRSMRAVLYSPTRNMIVNSGPIQPESLSEEVAGAETETETEPIATAGNIASITVEVRNGTAIKGFASQTADQIEAEGYSVLEIGDAKEKDYEKTLIIYRGEDKKLEQSINALAALLNTEVKNILPQEEPTFSGDALVILGNE